MPPTIAETTLEIKPATRLAVIDVAKQLAQHEDGAFAPYRKLLYCSPHTTAGYLEQSLCARLRHDRTAVEAFVQSAQKLFPEGAPYQHDQLHLRTELSEAQRRVEPRNADSHLAFIGLGLENCVTYDNLPDTPVYFIDLDGINGATQRNRRTTIVGFTEEVTIAEHSLTVPVSNHAVDSVNLRDPRLGVMAQLQELLDHYGIEQGKLILSLEPGEQHAGLTVNEYETLLMQHDLPDVLRNPLRFMAEKGFNMLRDPMSIRSKAKNYAKYDLVQVVNELIDVLGLNESLVERIIDKFFAASAARRLRMKRSVTLLIKNTHPLEQSPIVQGTYQSPILIQWQKAETQARTLNVRLTQFQ